MPNDPRTGVMVRPGGGTSLDLGFSGPAGMPMPSFMPTGMDAVSALLGRMPEWMGAAVRQKQQARGQAYRGEEQRQELEREGVQEERSRFRRSEHERKYKEAAAAQAARNEEQLRRQATVDRGMAMHQRYGGPYGFDPRGSIAEFYEYGGRR